MSIQESPEDITDYLFSLLTSKERADICSVNKWFEQQMVKVSKQLSPTPWLYDYERHHRVSKKYMKKVSMSDVHLIVRLKKSDLLLMCKEIGKSGDIFVLDLSFRELGSINATECLLGACKAGKLNMILELDQYAGGKIRGYECKQICKYGHVNILQRIISDNTIVKRNIGDDGFDGILLSVLPFPISDCLYRAAKHGHIEIINLLKKLPEFVNHVNDGLRGACAGGYIDIARDMISLGAKNLDEALGYACAYRQDHMMQLFLEQGMIDCSLCKKLLVNHNIK